MREKKIYDKISFLLYSFLKEPELSSKIRINKILKNKVIVSIDNLLALETDFGVKEETTKKSLLFAQLIVNVIGEEVEIEKPDNPSMDVIEDEYDAFAKYINDSFPELNFPLVLAKTDFISEKDITNLLNNNLKEEKKDLNSKTIPNNKSQSKFNGANDSQINNNNNNNNPLLEKGIMGLIGNNPMSDPRFYPYKTKPMWMPIYKKVLFFLAVITIVLMFAFNIYAEIKKVDIIIKNPSSPATPFFKGKLSLFPRYSMIMQLFIIVPIILFGVSIYGSKSKKRDQYIISPMMVLISLFSFSFITFVCISFAIPSVFGHALINEIASSIVKNNHSIPLNKATELASAAVHGIINGRTYKISQILAIILSVISLIMSVLFLITLFISPKIDKEKINRANSEYQKLIQSKMKGEEYIVDSSLFDDDLDQNDSSKTKKYKSDSE